MVTKEYLDKERATCQSHRTKKKILVSVLPKVTSAVRHDILLGFREDGMSLFLLKNISIFFGYECLLYGNTTSYVTPCH
jgi:hypothetical protein